MIDNHKKYLKRIYKSVNKILPESKVYLFGSILKRNLVGGSDIDILIIADIPRNHLKRAEIISEIEEDALLPFIHPFEFHLLTQEELDVWHSIYKLKILRLIDYL